MCSKKIRKENRKKGILGRGEVKKKFYKKYTIVETAGGEKFLLERMEPKERKRLEEYIKQYPNAEDRHLGNWLKFLYPDLNPNPIGSNH